VAATGQGEYGGDLELTEGMGFQRRLWKFQTIGRIVMAPVLLAAPVAPVSGYVWNASVSTYMEGHVTYPRTLALRACANR
jgi:hypothetical protein